MNTIAIEVKRSIIDLIRRTFQNQIAFVNIACTYFVSFTLYNLHAMLILHYYIIELKQLLEDKVVCVNVTPELHNGLLAKVLEDRFNFNKKSLTG